METNDYLKMLEALDEIEQLTAQQQKSPTVREAKEVQLTQPDISTSNDWAPIFSSEWCSLLSCGEDNPERECLKVGWAVYLATRSGYGEAALAYLTINGSDAFIERCCAELLPHFNQISSPLLPSGRLIGPFRFGGDGNEDA